MTLGRRRVLQLAAGAAALPRLAFAQGAQPWPSRPVRLIAGFPPGSAPDLVARLVGQSLSDSLGQPFVIENRPGAASNIGTDSVVRSAPDGTTLLMSVLTNVFNTTLYTNLSFNFERDFVHVAGVANAPYVVVVPLSFPAATIPEFIAYAKAHPGKINMASGGKGSSSHIFGELFKTMAGVDLVHVPYRANSMPDLISGQVQMFVAPIPQVLEIVRSGKLKALAVTQPKRAAIAPNVPTMVEAGVEGYSAGIWMGLLAPTGTPPEIVDKLSHAANEALKSKEVLTLMAAQGVDPLGGAPGQFAQFIDHELKKWDAVVKAAGIKTK